MYTHKRYDYVILQWVLWRHILLFYPIRGLNWVLYIYFNFGSGGGEVIKYQFPLKFRQWYQHMHIGLNWHFPMDWTLASLDWYSSNDQLNEWCGWNWWNLSQRLSLLQLSQCSYKCSSSKLKEECVYSACSSLNTLSTTIIIMIIIKTNIQNTICLLIHSDHLNTTDAATASLARDETWKMKSDDAPCQTSKCFDGGWIMNGSLHIRLKSPWNHIQNEMDRSWTIAWSTPRMKQMEFGMDDDLIHNLKIHSTLRVKWWRWWWWC